MGNAPRCRCSHPQELVMRLGLVAGHPHAVPIASRGLDGARASAAREDERGQCTYSSPLDASTNPSHPGSLASRTYASSVAWLAVLTIGATEVDRKRAAPN